MFDKLIDVLIQFIQLFQVYTFVDHYERGVILRCGKFKRQVKPGFRWLIPFGVERIISTNVKPEPMTFGIQSLHTADGYAVNIQTAIVFSVTDEKQYLLEVEHPNSVIAASCTGIIADRVQSTNWSDITTPKFPTSLKPAMNRRAQKCGCEIIAVYVQDCSAGEAKKYWHEGIQLNVSN